MTSSRTVLIEVKMQRVAAQPVLFSPKISRLALQRLNLAPEGAAVVSVNVWRNHAIEPVISLATPYFLYAGLNVQFRLSGYDDSLLFANHAAADLEILWLDSSRYLTGTSFSSWLEWLGSRVEQLRFASTAPIILATWCPDQEQASRLRALAGTNPGVYFADLGTAAQDANVGLLDKRSAAMTGTPLSNSAQAAIARKLGCHWLPAALLPPVKAIVLDLDNTLHAGVLGEDGIQGVQLSEAHASLQNYLRTLRERGIFVTLASRNEHPDVQALFAQREDYPLRWSDFSAVEVSWDDKATAIARIANTLNIGLDAVLFVDDNPGELASAVSSLPGLHVVHAEPDASLTQYAIANYPGLWRWKAGTDDFRRVQDLQANAQRTTLLAAASDPSAYFQSLQATLIFTVNPASQLDRLADLCKKTNQFNLAMRRLNPAEIANRLQREQSCVISIELKDRLSESGVIAVVVAQMEGDLLLIEELCISCRAMGRQLEDTMVLEAIRAMPQFEACTRVGFTVLSGPRNQPALDWLARLLQCNTCPEPGTHVLQASRIREFRPAGGLTLIRK